MEHTNVKSPSFPCGQYALTFSGCAFSLILHLNESRGQHHFPAREVKKCGMENEIESGGVGERGSE